MFQDLRKFFALCEKTQNFQYGLDESDSFTEEASEEAEDADEERENFDECVTDEECLEPEESCGEKTSRKMIVSQLSPPLSHLTALELQF